MPNYSALYEEDATDEEQVECYQALVNSGDAWKFEGHVGRTAMGLIEGGQILLGKEPRNDYWGNRVPGRDEVKAGTKGSYQFVVDHNDKEYADRLAAL